MTKAKAESNFKPGHDPPAYTAEGIRVWENTDKNGNPYLTVLLVDPAGIRDDVRLRAFPWKGNGN